MGFRWMLAAWLMVVVFSGTAQPASGYDAVSVYQDIRKLGVLANVLYVAAHPDDENTRMISYLSNHVGARTTYLSLTRGDGGQNLIGSEIREMLGIIRTHELLGARAIDGGHQLFTRANDFGYSKTAEETFRIWDREAVLSDVVWAMRTTRPDVIINRFSTDTSRPNHGHHTASAILAEEAFPLAADPNAYPEQLEHAELWQPRRIFWNTSWFFYGSQEAFEKVDKSRMLAIDIGAYNPVTGASNSEIAGRSRSMHKSQGFGSAETRGQSLDYIELLRDAEGTVPVSLFEGIDITWNRVSGGGTAIGAMVRQLEEDFDFRSPHNSVAALLEIRDAIDRLPASWWRTVKRADCDALIRKCLGLFVEARTRSFRISPGSPVRITLEVINRAPEAVRLQSVAYGDSMVYSGGEIELVNNVGHTQELTLAAPDKLSTPYWLVDPPSDGMYVVKDQLLRGQPADGPTMELDVTVAVGGRRVTCRVPVIFKIVDPAEGEISRLLSITPPVAVALEEESLLFQPGQPRTVPVTITALQENVEGQLTLNISAPGWSASPDGLPIRFAKAGESETVQVTLFPPGQASTAVLTPAVSIGNQSWHHQVVTLDYPHLPYMSIIRHASVRLESSPIAITPRRIAYIQGAGDEVPAALRQIGYEVTALEADEISPAVLAGYEVVILGVRAFNTVEALAYKNKILFDWVRSGGTMIVQYNVSRGLVTPDIAPFPLTLSRDRVTEEQSPVVMLHQDHPALSIPNRITEDDFGGWVQERGLYFPNEWDPAYTPLLQLQDTGDRPMTGSLLVAPYGKGHYIYSGLSWFRHLPAGNPGPFRLLSNLISLGYQAGKS